MAAAPPPYLRWSSARLRRHLRQTLATLENEFEENINWEHWNEVLPNASRRELRGWYNSWHGRLVFLLNRAWEEEDERVAWEAAWEEERDVAAPVIRSMWEYPREPAPVEFIQPQFENVRRARIRADTEEMDPAQYATFITPGEIQQAQLRLNLVEEGRPETLYRDQHRRDQAVDFLLSERRPEWERVRREGEEADKPASDELLPYHQAEASIKELAHDLNRRERFVADPFYRQLTGRESASKRIRLTRLTPDPLSEYNMALWPDILKEDAERDEEEERTAYEELGQLLQATESVRNMVRDMSTRLLKSRLDELQAAKDAAVEYDKELFEAIQNELEERQNLFDDL